MTGRRKKFGVLSEVPDGFGQESGSVSMSLYGGDFGSGCLVGGMKRVEEDELVLAFRGTRSDSGRIWEGGSVRMYGMEDDV